MGFWSNVFGLDLVTSLFEPVAAQVGTITNAAPLDRASGRRTGGNRAVFDGRTSSCTGTESARVRNAIRHT